MPVQTTEKLPIAHAHVN